MSLSKVLEVARLELGVTESPPGSNRVKYWAAYDPKMQGQPWCVAFLWWVYQQAGERMAFFGGGKTASCGMLLRWYREQGLTVPVSEVQVGDIVILNFHGTQDTEHCGLVVEPHWHQDVTLDYVYTIEGNTSDGNGSQSNGGCVALKRRYPHQIVGVCKPMYKAVAGLPQSPAGDSSLPEGAGTKDEGTVDEGTKDDVSGHWAEDAIRRCMKRKIITGFPDGTFRPNEPVTRAEAATMIDRLVQLLIGEDDGK